MIRKGNEMKPIVILILDGAADVPGCPDYASSPLETARTIGLDELAQNGHAGLLYPIDKGVIPETHSGMLNLFGYYVMPDEVPRGPIEALGCGLDVRDGDLALRVNFGTRDETTGLITDRRVCRSLSMVDTSTLCHDIVEHLREANLDYELYMRAARKYRAVAAIRSTKIRLSDAISNTDPGYPTESLNLHSDEGFEPIACHPLEDSEAACQTADIVNDFVHKAEEFLQDHPFNHLRRTQGKPLANVLLTRGPGCSLPRVENISSKFGLQFKLLADLPIERGVGVLVGCDCHSYVPNIDLEKTYSLLVEEVKQAAVPGTVTIIHVKGPDEYGHDGDFSGKVRCLEEVDQYLIEPLARAILEYSIMVVTSDHSTPCFAHVHTADPVPFVIAGSRIPLNGAKRITERDCTALQSPVSLGSQLLDFVVALAKE
jgi:2,3-bisphosphoglycerate-independent phosphoglycerate mutase